MSSSASSFELRREGLVFALIGPAGGGKTTFCRRLIQEFAGSLTLSVSATTRTPRPDESAGISKHFLTREEFEGHIARQELFEWEEVHGNLYGTLNSTLEKTIHSGSDLLLDIDVRGALKFKQRLPLNTVICVIVPPSAKVLEQRILSRSPVPDAELKARLATAAVEYQAFMELARNGTIDYFTVNDQQEAAYQLVKSQLVAERSRVSRLNCDDLGAICSI